MALREAILLHGRARLQEPSSAPSTPTPAPRASALEQNQHQSQYQYQKSDTKMPQYQKNCGKTNQPEKDYTKMPRVYYEPLPPKPTYMEELNKQRPLSEDPVERRKQQDASFAKLQAMNRAAGIVVHNRPTGNCRMIEKCPVLSSTLR